MISVDIGKQHHAELVGHCLLARMQCYSLFPPQPEAGAWLDMSKGPGAKMFLKCENGEGQSPLRSYTEVSRSSLLGIFHSEVAWISL